jgi:hypothetical protein
MKRIVFFCLMGLVCVVFLFACEEEEGQSLVVVEQIDDYQADLPPVPKISVPDVPETYSDGSYSVFGVRRNVSKTMDTPVTVTAYIANVYQKPVCPEGITCHTLMPHLFLADDPNESMHRRYLRLVGYAQSFKEMEDEQANDEAGKERELPEGVYLPPVIWDWRQGHKYKITGSFSRQSGAGFMDTDGLMEYDKHECLDCPAEDEDEAAEKEEPKKEDARKK